MSCGLGADELFTKENFKQSKLVVDCGDEPQTMHYNQMRVQNADMVLTPDIQCYNVYKDNGYNVIFTSHWTDLNIFYPSLTSYEPFDVVSSMYGDRGEIIPYLRNNLGSSFYLKNNLKDIENGDLYRNGKIVFQKSDLGKMFIGIFKALAFS